MVCEFGQNVLTKFTTHNFLLLNHAYTIKTSCCNNVPWKFSVNFNVCQRSWNPLRYFAGTNTGILSLAFAQCQNSIICKCRALTSSRNARWWSFSLRYGEKYARLLPWGGVQQPLWSALNVGYAPHFTLQLAKNGSWRSKTLIKEPRERDECKRPGEKKIFSQVGLGYASKEPGGILG